MHSMQKKADVPLEEALDIAGGGRYTSYVLLTTGLIYFSSLLSIQGMAIVMPAAGCDMQLTNSEKGIINSMTFTGMLFSAQLFGFLADTFGRKRTMQVCQVLNMVCIVLWCVAPDTITLSIVLFINGFIVTGCLTPAYVVVSEFCPAQMRSRCLVVMNAFGAMANVYLPALAWILIPMDVYMPIYENLVFTSWRLFIISLLIPVLGATILLWQLPETPKYLLSQGKSDETLEVMKTIYAINQKKSKDEFPVISLCLDSTEEESRKTGGNNNQFVYYLKMMVSQTGVLFSKHYFLFTLLSCLVLFGEGGVYNTLMLWFPEQSSRIMHYSASHEVFNVTLCNLMKSDNALKVGKCQLNFDFLTASVLLGSCQVASNLIIGLCFQRIRRRKLSLALALFSSGATIFVSIFLTSQYVIIAAFSLTIVTLYLMFPVVVSIIVELFPTPLRSTATSITMTCARLGATMGSQIMGILYENHCRKGYFGISFILVISGVLCILMPNKKKKTSC